MPMGITGSYDTDSSLLEVLRQRSDQVNQNEVQSAVSAAEPAQQEDNENNENSQQLRLDSNSLDSTANKHSRNLIDIYA